MVNLSIPIKCGAEAKVVAFIKKLIKVRSYLRCVYVGSDASCGGPTAKLIQLKYTKDHHGDHALK